MIAAIVPARNCAAWIREALRSLADQTRPPDEILMYDDGSTDDTVALAEATGIERLRILRGSTPGGISAALNQMLDATSARYVVRMDADDIAEPDRLRIQLEAMESRELAVVGSWARRFGNADTLHRFAEDDHDLKAGLLFAAPFCHPTVIFDRQRLRNPSLLRYDSDFDGAEDHELWIRLRHEGRYGNVGKVLLNWRLHGDNAGSHPEKLARQLEVQARLRGRILESMGIELGGRQGAALAKRCSAKVLCRDEHEPFLDALATIARTPVESLGAPREAVLRVLASHWDLSCLFAVQTQPKIPALWRQGRLRLGLGAPPAIFAKIALKSMIHLARRIGNRPSPAKA